MMAASIGTLTTKTAREVMAAVDQATKQALAAMGLEAFRFDIDYCPAEGWMRLKVKIRQSPDSRD